MPLEGYFVPNRLHTIFAVNDETGECADCRRRFRIPSEKDKYGYRIINQGTLEERIKLLTPEYSEGAYMHAVGYCQANLNTYLNPTEDTLNLAPLGLGKISPGEIFTLGAVNSPKAVKSYAPQVIHIEASPGAHALGLDLFPYTIQELVTWTSVADFKRIKHVQSDFANSPRNR
jgi:hypothetical protein